MLDIPNFKTKKELFNFLVENKDMLISQKKAELKHADGIGISVTEIKNIDKISKTSAEEVEKDEITVKVVINTTNIMDSHKDVHIPGLWSKSLKENKRIMHVQEHKTHEFKSIISSGKDLKAYTKSYSWKDLGFNAEGETEALEFESKVRKERNEEMFNAYSKGYVDNHSVGMQYVKLELAINDEDYEKELDFWNKYIDQVVNREQAEKIGYFWVVTEAKVIEGSAVPLGSNPITPTVSAKDIEVVVEEDDADTLAYKDFLNIK